MSGSAELIDFAGGTTGYPSTLVDECLPDAPAAARMRGFSTPEPFPA
jgi:hypothetical protein